MNGSNPKPPQFSPKPPSRRPAKAQKQRRALNVGGTPWLFICILFVLYAVMGLLMSLPQPPYWVWIATLVAIPLLTLGLNRPVNLSGKKDLGSLMAYLGGLIMAIALAVAANYIGSEQDLESVRFFTAIFVLAALTLLVVLLTAAAAIVNAQTGQRFMSNTNYARAITIVMSICFLGLCLGGVFGFTLTTLS